MIQHMQMQALEVGYFTGYVYRENLPPAVWRRLGPNAKPFRNEAALRWPVTVSNNGLTRLIVLHHNRQGPNRLDILVVQRRCCPKSCDKRVRYGFVGQGGAPTLQENDKKTVADFLGSQQKLGRRFKKDASVGMSGGCAMAQRRNRRRRTLFKGG